jgi:hypothetical protein
LLHYASTFPNVLSPESDLRFTGFSEVRVQDPRSYGSA